ncbi:MAG TPA: hypothetical protein VKC35_20045 [Vicinamibacterales bacterium]|nr:hypothetical protein [Vicinamibacterales bacterium]
MWLQAGMRDPGSELFGDHAHDGRLPLRGKRIHTRAPANEHHQHQPVDDDDDLVDARRLRRGFDWESDLYVR